MLAANRAKGVPMGQSLGFDPAVARRWIDVGVSWFSSGGDWHLLFPAAKSLCEQIKVLT